MNVRAGGLIRAAWALFRRDARVLLAASAPFLFFPAFAVHLLADPPPMPFAATPEWFDRAAAWGEENLWWYLLASLAGTYGIGVLALLLADPDRPTVRAALGRALRLLPRFVLAAVLVAIPAAAGLYLFVLPGLYVQARLAPVPLLVAQAQVSAIRAVGLSWRLTAPLAWPLLGAVILIFLAQWLAAMLLLPAEAWLRQPSHANPFVLALVSAAITAMLAAYRVALLLLGAVACRRSSGT